MSPLSVVAELVTGSEPGLGGISGDNWISERYEAVADITAGPAVISGVGSIWLAVELVAAQ